MIQSLHLKNFKSFEDECFKLGNLTLLTGLNGTGKSSILQSIVLLRQSYQHQFLLKKRLLLNGELVQLGTVDDVLYEGAKEDVFGFDLHFRSNIEGKWLFECENETLEGRVRDQALPMDVVKQISGNVSNKVYNTCLFGDDFHYLPADRIGPQPAFEISDHFVREHRQLGGKGEYAPHFLFTFQTRRFDDDAEVLIHPNTDLKNTNLLGQLEAWMGEISPGVRIALTEYPGIDRMELRYSFLARKGYTRNYRSTNVGFGITYTLPILLALLASEKDSLVLLENPEAHLHPQGQFKLGELMARAAGYGIQVIVESHSDHVLNGIRIAVREKLIEPDKVRLYYLSRSDNEFSSKVDSPLVDEDGRIDQWPDGFFDEYEKSLEQLF